MNYGKLGTPVVYRETAQSAHFGMLVPVQMSVGGNSQSATIAVVGADVMVRNRVIFIYAFNTSTTAEATAKSGCQW